MNKGVLTLFCGKMGAGKTTAANRIAAEKQAVLLSEDEWLASLYPNKIKSLQDYIAYSSLLKGQMKKLVQAILISGSDVVMDFPANTIAQRNWLSSISSEIEAANELIYIDLSNELCLKQIEKRRTQQAERAATDTAEMFEQVTKYFVAPSAAEGFNITRITGSEN